MADCENTAPSVSRPTPTRRKYVSVGFAFLGLAVLGFVFGAAVMFFRLPTSEFLTKAFVGAQAWNERHSLEELPRDEGPAPAGDSVDIPAKTFDGFTLCTFATLKGDNTQALLFNMERQLVHRWAIPFSLLWNDPPHVRGPVSDDFVCFFGSRMFPNGDLLVVLHGLQQQAVGYGLIKLDKDSNVIWKHAANIHHDIDIGEDGTIYALQHEIAYQLSDGLHYIPTPCLTDSIVMLTPDGKVKGKPISILEAFRDSPYATLLREIEPDENTQQPAGEATTFGGQAVRIDALHANYVKVLTKEMAARFPSFKAGHLLISLRHLNTIAMVDPEHRVVVWAATGPWKAQHDPQFLENGDLLLFDNRGLPGKRSRVLEYNPSTQAFPWTYSGENRGPFYSSERGMSQRLPNGNTLIVNSEGGELLEVTREKEVAWTCRFPQHFIT
ncbi:MAG TPA: arylsulfotransferase family protein, partial [Gemmata sp.]|nr:arylsulfotransferase family protein [Gemmata sp.]